MKPLMLAAGIGLAAIAVPASAQYGGGGMGGMGRGGYQTGAVERSADDENIGVDDGSGIIQGRTDIRKKKPKKKKDANCREEKVNGYRVSNCW
jgi:hypothetical protein